MNRCVCGLVYFGQTVVVTFGKEVKSLVDESGEDSNKVKG